LVNSSGAETAESAGRRREDAKNGTNSERLLVAL